MRDRQLRGLAAQHDIDVVDAEPAMGGGDDDAAAAKMGRQQPREPGARLGIEADGRLVEQPQRAVDERQARQCKAPPLAGRTAA